MVAVHHFAFEVSIVMLCEQCAFYNPSRVIEEPTEEDGRRWQVYEVLSGERKILKKKKGKAKTRRILHGNLMNVT